MSSAQIAFFIGLFGSVHCIGMCGPLAFAVPVPRRVWWYIVGDKILYNFGRILSYTLLGFLIGFAGRQLWISGLQQGLSLVSGMLIILAGLSRIFKFGLARGKRSLYDVLPINRALNYALQHRAGHLFIGIINGFLPCGFVYIALVGAINIDAPLAAAQYMFWFGLGTFPLMLIATVSASTVGPLLRRRINKAMPYLMICLGFWFLVRGSGLNVPYLSTGKLGNGVVCK